MKNIVVKEQHWFSKIAVWNSKKNVWISKISLKRKRRRSDTVFWRKPLYQQKIQKRIDNTKRPPKTSITQRLWTDLELSVGVVTVIQLLWFNLFTIPNLPTNRKGCVIKRTHNFMSKLNSNLILYNSKINL